MSELRPAPTTTVAVALLVAMATMPLRDVFGDWRWTLSVIGAAIVSSVLASLLESTRLRLPTGIVVAVTALGAALWGAVVARRDLFWGGEGADVVWEGLREGVFGGWDALLDEQVPLTDPRSAETFAAVLAWIAGAAAVHVAVRRRTALGAIAVSAVVLGVSSAAALPRGLPPSFFGAGAGIAALFAIATLTRAADQRWRIGRVTALCGLIGLAGLIALGAGVAATSVEREPLDPRSTRDVAIVEIEVPDILAEFGVRRDEDRTALRIESTTPPAGLRLRLQVYDEHDGARWIPATGFEEIPTFPRTLELPPGDIVDLTIQLDDLDGPWVPLPDRLIDIDLTDVRWNADAQTMIRDEMPTDYRVSGTLVSRAGLDGLEAARDEIPQRVRDIPPGLPESIRAAAVDATEDATDAVGAIDAITAMLRELGRTDDAAPGNSFGRLRDALESGEPTGAEQIASLHALMLRSVGIPSRLVVGYVASDTVVQASDLHIWVEAAFTGLGWVPIDPVPATSVSTDEDRTDVTPPSTTAAPAAPLEARALPRELGPGEDPDQREIIEEDPFTRGDAATIVLIVIGAAFVALFLVRIGRRYYRHNVKLRPEVRVLGAWAELVDRLRELGAPIAATTTTGDVVYMADRIDEELGGHAAGLATLAALALHGPGGSEPEEGEAAWLYLRDAEARIVEIKGRRAVPRRYLDPRVLRYRAPKPPSHRDGGRRTWVRG